MHRLHSRAGLAACSLFILLAILLFLTREFRPMRLFFPPPFFPTLTMTYVYPSCLTMFL